MQTKGWIKVYRKIQDSFIWTDANQLKLWLLILMKANHEDNRFLFNGQEVHVSSGQLVTGSVALASAFNEGVTRDKRVTSRTVWRWVKKFEKEQMLSIKSTTKYSVITVIKWDEYQSSDKHVSSGCQAPVKHLSTNKNDKNVKKNSEAEKIPFAEIIEYLNQKTGKRFKNVAGNQKYIKARWHEGNRLDDFKHVIDVKVAEWLGTDWAKYLRPVTLFGNKFDEYLNQGVKPKENQNTDKQKAERLKQIQRFVLGQYIDGCKPEEIQQLVAERNANLSLAAINKIIERGDA